MLFLWMVMLGSAVALHRGEHMRLVLGRDSLSALWRQRLETFCAVVIALFVVEVVGPAWHYQVNQAAIDSPALGITENWRAASLVVGFGDLPVPVPVPARRAGRALQVAGSLLLAGAVALGLWLARPWLLAIGNDNLLVFFVLLVGRLRADRRADRLLLRHGDGGLSRARHARAADGRGQPDG